ncbi:gamma-glutamylcyclotransferase family protein [Paenibacillus sp. 32352]|uniref:gamma-glutamylcyclotransferase family protein n=1 Tax=Paenibacillus sp. 32352 TaxID=1969111 RepID=UPI0009AC2DBC|nr:gamma-glutamylcyclotransferase family protein [Paenibacillus sp. 32352]
MSKRILVATYGVLMNSKEMKRHEINAYGVAKGVIERHDLQFRGLPSQPKGQPIIIEKPYGIGSRYQVPVLIWSIPEENEGMLDKIESFNIGKFIKKYLPVRIDALSVEGVVDGVPSDEVTALVYIPDGDRISKQLTLPDINLMFSAYQEHGIDTAILVIAAIAARTAYEEREFEAYEKIKECLQSTKLDGENPEIVSHILITKRLLGIVTAKFPFGKGDEN